MLAGVEPTALGLGAPLTRAWQWMLADFRKSIDPKSNRT